MGDLISRKPKSEDDFILPAEPDPKPRTDQLFVRGTFYSNAAAKFWPNLFDEVCDEFPECSSFELSAMSGEQLDRTHLFPENALSRDLNSLGVYDIDKAMHRAIEEMEIFGPPSAVGIRLFGGKKLLATRELPQDCIDSETFSYLVVWPLEWAGIAPWRWKDEHLSGEMRAEDKRRRRVYKIVFSLTNKHVSEGLFKRSILIAHHVQS